jgi:formate dehydrogenase (NADP+) beta subunit
LPLRSRPFCSAASARVGDRREVGYITGIGNIEFRHKRIDSMKAVLAEGFDAALVGSGAPLGRDLDVLGRKEGGANNQSVIDQFLSIAREA